MWAVPPTCVSSITPVIAPFGTVVCTSVALALLTSAGTLPLMPAKVTAGSFPFTLRLVPVNVTCVPGVPRFGVKSVMAGAEN